MEEGRPPGLVKDILRYYVKHPATADTTEGLARWRLLEDYVEQTTRHVEEALDWLVDRGLLTAMVGPGKRRVFVLNAARREEAEGLLDAWKEERCGGR
jgi:hypothetical protein